MDQEYHFPVLPQEVPEFPPPGEEYPLPDEGYGTRAEEIPKPGTGEETAPKEKRMTKMLVTAVLGISLVTSAAAVSPAPVLEPETEPMMDIDQYLVDVGDWVSEDGLRAHFDEYTGWMILPDETVSIFSWDLQGDEVYTYGFISGTTTVYDPTSGQTFSTTSLERGFHTLQRDEEDPNAVILSNMLEQDDEKQLLLPAETPTPEPDVAYDKMLGKLAGTNWKMSYISECKAGWEHDSSDFFAGFEIRISNVAFTEDTCTVTMLDVYGGSKDFHYTWRYQENTPLPIVLLEPQEPIEYELPDRTVRSERQCEVAILQSEVSEMILWMPSYVIFDPNTIYVPMELDWGNAEEPWEGPWEELEPTEEPEFTEDIDVAQMLCRVGTWISEDGQMLVHFDVDGGWWKETNGDTYGLMSWWKDGADILYSGFASQIQSGGEIQSIDYLNRSLVINQMEWQYVTIYSLEPNPVIAMEDPISGEWKTYVPTEDVWESSPAYFYDRDLRQELPNTSWMIAPFSGMEADRAAAESNAEIQWRNFIWISDATFTEDTCVITLSDNFGGSASFDFTWEYAQEGIVPEIYLYPTDELSYQLTDSATQTTFNYSSEAAYFRAVMSLNDDGPVLYLYNPFFHSYCSPTHYPMIRYR